MKNAMKKIMSLVLVAMLLVSAIPFGASALVSDGFYVVPVLDTRGREQGAVRIPVAESDTTVAIPDTFARDAAMVAGYNNVALCNIQYLVNGNPNPNVTTGYALDVNTNLSVVVSAAPQGNGDEGTVDVDPAVTHLVQFVDPQFKVVASFTVEDGDTLKETVNVDMTKIQASSVAHLVPAGQEFAGWRDVVSANSFNTTTVYHANTTYMMVTQPVANDNTTNNNTGSNTNTNTGSSNTGSSNSGSSNTGSSNSGSSSTGSTTGGNNYNANTGAVTNTQTSYSKFAYPVYLNIYTDTTVGTVKKTVNITNGIAADGRVTLSEVKNLVPNYFTAIDGNVGIIYDGLYPAQGNWVFNYAIDTKYDVIEGLYDAASNNYVYINVMITNAKAYTSSSSNSTNPKTGDEIYMAVTGLALTASALAAVYYISKKHAMV